LGIFDYLINFRLFSKTYCSIKSTDIANPILLFNQILNKQFNKSNSIKNYAFYKHISNYYQKPFLKSVSIVRLRIILLLKKIKNSAY